MKYTTGNQNNFTAYDSEEAGESLAIFLSQTPGDSARLYFAVYAILSSGGQLLVGTFNSSPPIATDPQGQPTRLVAYASCPGAVGWTVRHGLAASYIGGVHESYGVDLGSSKGIVSPSGVTRVNQRYNYAAGQTTDTSYTVAPGQKILSWTAVAPSTAGSVQLGTGQVIQVPAGAAVQAEPGSGLLAAENFTFTNVDWFIEYLESA